MRGRVRISITYSILQLSIIKINYYLIAKRHITGKGDRLRAERRKSRKKSLAKVWKLAILETIMEFNEVDFEKKEQCVDLIFQRIILLLKQTEFSAWFVKRMTTMCMRSIWTSFILHSIFCAAFQFMREFYLDFLKKWDSEVKPCVWRTSGA